MKEEEVRSRHRALLLQLREKALKVHIFIQHTLCVVISFSFLKVHTSALPISFSNIIQIPQIFKKIWLCSKTQRFKP